MLKIDEKHLVQGTVSAHSVTRLKGLSAGHNMNTFDSHLEREWSVFVVVLLACTGKTSLPHPKGPRGGKPPGGVSRETPPGLSRAGPAMPAKPVALVATPSRAAAARLTRQPGSTARQPVRARSFRWPPSCASSQTGCACAGGCSWASLPQARRPRCTQAPPPA